MTTCLYRNSHQQNLGNGGAHSRPYFATAEGPRFVRPDEDPLDSGPMPFDDWMFSACAFDFGDEVEEDDEMESTTVYDYYADGCGHSLVWPAPKRHTRARYNYPHRRAVKAVFVERAKRKLRALTPTRTVQGELGKKRSYKVAVFAVTERYKPLCLDRTGDLTPAVRRVLRVATSTPVLSRAA